LASDLSFQWDEENISHLARHRIVPSEVEECFWNDPVLQDYQAADGEDRWTALGATNSMRVLVLVFTVREGKIRPITGWNADKKTTKKYYLDKG
jgi:uncharacterized protein